MSRKIECIKKEKRPKRVILTGYRGTGKTTIGRLLADEIGYEFVDTDLLICTQTGKTVVEIVEKGGWLAFRHLEIEVLTTLAGQAQVVIATGGGAILHQAAWDLLRQDSFCCWLRAEEAVLVRRLAGDAASGALRPALKKGSLVSEVRAGLAEREPYYGAGSDVSIETGGKTPAEIVVKIVSRLKSDPYF